MPTNVKITSQLKDTGIYRAKGEVTAEDGTVKGTAELLVRKGATGAAELVATAGDAKSVILGNEVQEFKSYDGPGPESTPELAKGAELTFSNLVYAL